MQQTQIVSFSYPGRISISMHAGQKTQPILHVNQSPIQKSIIPYEIPYYKQFVASCFPILQTPKEVQFLLPHGQSAQICAFPFNGKTPYLSRPIWAEEPHIQWLIHVDPLVDLSNISGWWFQPYPSEK
jgi:hypothetical protein